MIGRRAFLASALGVAMAGPAVAQKKPKVSWDGVWGRQDGVLVTVSGNQVAYAYNGRPFPVGDVRMSPSQLSFYFGSAGHAVMNMNPDGTANMDGTLNGKPFSMKIWRAKG